MTTNHGTKGRIKSDKKGIVQWKESIHNKNKQKRPVKAIRNSANISTFMPRG